MIQNPEQWHWRRWVTAVSVALGLTAAAAALLLDDEPQKDTTFCAGAPTGVDANRFKQISENRPDTFSYAICRERNVRLRVAVGNFEESIATLEDQTNRFGNFGNDLEGTTRSVTETDALTIVVQRHIVQGQPRPRYLALLPKEPGEQAIVMFSHDDEQLGRSWAVATYNELAVDDQGYPFTTEPPVNTSGFYTTFDSPVAMQSFEDEQIARATELIESSGVNVSAAGFEYEPFL